MWFSDTVYFPIIKKSPGLKVASNHYICRGLNSIKVDRDINEQPSLSLLLKLPNDSS